MRNVNISVGGQLWWKQGAAAVNKTIALVFYLREGFSCTSLDTCRCYGRVWNSHWKRLNCNLPPGGEWVYIRIGLHESTWDNLIKTWLNLDLEVLSTFLNLFVFLVRSSVDGKQTSFFVPVADVINLLSYCTDCGRCAKPLHSSSNRTPEYEPRCFPAVCVGTHSAPLTAINCICTMCRTMEPQLELAEAVRAGHWAFLSAETAKSARGDSLRGLFVSMWGKHHTNGIGQTWSEASELVLGYVLTSLLIQLFMSHQPSLHAIISQTLCSLNPEVYIYFMAAPPNELQKCDCYSHFWMNTLIRKTRIT